MADRKLDGKKVLMVIPPTQFREEEFFEPKRILEEEGAAVTVASTSVRVCRGMQGRSAEAVVSIADAKADEFHAIILCGGSAVPESLWTDKKLPELVSQMAAAGKVVAAISLSTVVLAKAKLLSGKNATVYFLPQAIQELRTAGATYIKDPLIVDGNLIMAESPADSAKWGNAILTALAQA